MNVRALREQASALLAGAAAIAFAASVLPSVPALRQDWSPYPFGVGAKELFWIGTSGWDVGGIGAPMPYPQAYLVAPLLALLRLVLGAEGVLFVFMLAAGALCAFGGRALARSLGAGETAAAAAALFLTFNPWTFNELVAGHTYMLLAYGATILLIAEALRTPSRATVLVLCLLASFQQIQFALIDTLLLLFIAWRQRLWIPALVAVLVWLPSVIGIVAERHALSSIPLTLSWEHDQSVTPLGALALNGYFAHYGDRFSGTHSMPVCAIGLLAACGAASVMRRSRPAIAIALLTLLSVVVAMGLRGPLAAPFSWGVAHVPAVGVFRELYDLLGFTAIGYALGALVLRARTVTPLFAISSLALAVLWWVPPPATWWVESSQLPTLSVTAPENTRFALIPAFQPLSFGERGDGADPDAYARFGNVTPLNAYLATYPADAALGRFVQSGDTRALRALSVSRAFERTYLRSNAGALAEQSAFSRGVALRGPAGNRTIALSPLPELSLLTPPAIGSVDDELGAGNIFFGDAGGTFLPIAAPNGAVDARRGWVDARLAFAQRPELAQGFGGALTATSRARLALRGGLEALVWIDGALRSQDGSVLSRTTRGYAWIALAHSVTTVTCTGVCVVAAQGLPPDVPANPPPRAYRAIGFSLLSPWLVRASVPPGRGGALRYNVAYDDGWTAYLHGVALKHLRLDTSVNGWLLPPRSARASLLIVERTAAAQSVAELVVVCVLLALGAARLRRAWRHR